MRKKSSVRSVKNRTAQINRIGRKLGERFERQRFSIPEIVKARKRPFVRRERKLKLRPMIAYDLETSRIESGTPKLLYLTAYCDSWTLSTRLRGTAHFLEILETRFLIPENVNARFVAWNGNNFDVYFVAMALLHSENYIIRPYLTRSKNLRGLRVTRVDDKKQSWEFLDGISITGLTEKSLKWFLSTFASEHQKLDAPEWETVSFNPLNEKHREYAERDSEGLYHAMVRVEKIIADNFNLGLMATIGNLGIKVFQAHIPDDAQVWEPSYQCLQVLRRYVMRGGYCFCRMKYEGPIWKYDLNQAYAAAMRETLLPSGACFHTKKIHSWARTGVYRIRALNKFNRVPFYYRDSEGVSMFGLQSVSDTWVTSIELEQLQRENWRIEIMEGYFWDDCFVMRDYVGKLEKLRSGAIDGPSGPQGTIMKMIGNNSYGKTVETLDGIELVMANECPEGYNSYQCEDERLQHIWFRFGRPILRDYHQPQIGCFITAHVRMVLRRVILLNPDAWLYADTDCVVFRAPVKLDIDPKRYGAWKIECEGELYRIIAKKVYASFNGNVKHAKGMNVKRLSVEDFERWFSGDAPVQTQLHRQNFLKVMTGFEMFIERTKIGERKIA